MQVGQLQGGEFAHHVVEQRLRIGIVRVVGRCHGREPNAGAVAADGFGHGARHFQQKACAVGDAATVVVLAVVASGLEELVDQVAVGGVDLHTVETGGDGVERGVAVVHHDAGYLFGVERARLGGVDEGGRAVLDQHRLGVGADRRGRDRRAKVWLQLAV
ncbi:hypothetical protein D9M69_575740 [compost metagenome]